MNPEIILDRKRMEDFFRSNLGLFPKAQSVTELRIERNHPDFIFDPSVILVEYHLTIKKNDGLTEKVNLRGSTGSGEKRLKHFEIIKALGKNGFDREQNRVAEPFGYFPEYNLFIYKNISGQSLYDKLQYSSKNEWKQKISDSISWLAEFHKKKPANIASIELNPQEEERKFLGIIATLKDKYGEQADLIERVSKKIGENQKSLLNPKDFSLVHGDFQPDNIIFTNFPFLTYCIDFNDSMLYDELYDLIYFTTQTQEMKKRIDGTNIEKITNSAMKVYLDKRGIKISKQLDRKIQLFRIKTLLQIKAVLPHDEARKLVASLENYANKN